MWWMKKSGVFADLSLVWMLVWIGLDEMFNFTVVEKLRWEDGVQLRANWHRLNKVGPKDQELDDGDQPSVNFNG